MRKMSLVSYLLSQSAFVKIVLAICLVAAVSVSLKIGGLLIILALCLAFPVIKYREYEQYLLLPDEEDQITLVED